MDHESKPVVNWAFIASPAAWLNCFSLLHDLTSSPKHMRLKIFLGVSLLMFMCLWGWMFWRIVFDAGSYIEMVSSVANGSLSRDDAFKRFNELIWKTVLVIFFLSLTYGSTIACHQGLAAVYRMDIMERLISIQFSSNSLLWDSCSEAMRERNCIGGVGDLAEVSRDIHSFVHHLSHMLFGGLYFIGLVQVVAMLAVFCDYVVRSSGESSGIGLLFAVFGFCLFLEFIVSYLYTSTVSGYTDLKTSIYRYVHSLLAYAESVSFMRGQCVEQRVLYRKLDSMLSITLKHATWFMALYFPVGIMMQMGVIATFVIPTAVYFFGRENQSPSSASTYLIVISFYGFIFGQLSNILQVTESAMHALTVGNRLYSLKLRLLQKAELIQQQKTAEDTYNVRAVDDKHFELNDLSVEAPGSGKELHKVSLSVKAGECLLITGESGSGKTSLFRICAGLWPVPNVEGSISTVISMPRRLLFVPQKPYVPLGSLRLQLQLLLQTDLVLSDQNVLTVLQCVNLNYLVPRFGLDSDDVDWVDVLSVGELQRLGFARIFSVLLFGKPEQKPTLLFFDESSSAIDLDTESHIYSTLQSCNAWFVTIFHRHSVLRFHQQHYSLSAISKSAGTIRTSAVETAMCTSYDMKTGEAETFTKTTESGSVEPTTQLSCLTWWSWMHTIEYLRSFWQFLNFSYPDLHKYRFQRMLLVMLYFVSAVVIAGNSVVNYYSVTYVSDIYGVFGSYIDGAIDVAEARHIIRHNVGRLFGLVIGSLILFTLQIGCGRYLAALLSHRQSTHISTTLLTGNTLWYCHQLGNQVAEIPAVLSSDIVDFNLHFGQLLFGTIYHNGLFSIMSLLIPYSILLHKNGGTTALITVYLAQLIFSSMIFVVDMWFAPRNAKSLSAIATLACCHRRVDLLAEQIALSGSHVQNNEANHIRSELCKSRDVQLHAAIPYGIFVGISNLSMVCSGLIIYVLPAAILLTMSNTANIASDAADVLTVSVYASYLQGNLANLSYLYQHWSFMRAFGTRIFAVWSNIENLNKLSGRAKGVEQRHSLRRIGENNAFSAFNIDVHAQSFSRQDKLTLIKNLTFNVTSNDDMVVVGVSGCGKSTLLRLLAGLQCLSPIDGGQSSDGSDLASEESLQLLTRDENGAYIVVPPDHTVAYLPQIMFLVDGTLKQVLQYLPVSLSPELYATSLDSWPVQSDREVPQIFETDVLQKVLDDVGLGYLSARYGWDTSVSWSKVLSGGEQQRLSIASALLSKATCIVMDESTSAVDSENEERIFKLLKAHRKQHLCVSHRLEVRKYHSVQLTIDKCGVGSVSSLSGREDV